jgi:hypothetical protein
MKTVIVLSLFTLLLVACTDTKKEPVDQTRTTSAIIVQPTLHDGHAAEPNVDEQFDQNEVDEMMDGDQLDMSGVRDGG